MILAALTSSIVLSASQIPWLEKDLAAPPGTAPAPHLLRDLTYPAPGAFAAPSVLLVQSALPPDSAPDANRPGPHALPQNGATQRLKLRIQPGGPPPIAERTPNLYRVPDHCKDAPVKVQDRFGRPVAQKLADLPKGALIYAVDRKVDGCPVLVVVYGTPALDNPNPPPPSGPEKVTPAKSEDAPSNKR